MTDRERIRELTKRLEETQEALYRELQGESGSAACDFLHERIGLWDYIRRGRLSYALSAPVIYVMIVPAIILDLCVTFYQAFRYPIYRIPRAGRFDYIAHDRHRLPYLNLLQKFNCLYCGYFNGLIDSVCQIASRTEQFWCPIRHARRIEGVTARYWHFLPYGDGHELNRRWQILRRKLREEGDKKSDEA